MSRRQSEGDLEGILLVDKEPGWTSHDVVAKVRGIARQRRTGHTGTLDPAATGLLVLCMGRATRLVEYMTVHDKAYEGEIRLGQATDTDDAEGSVISERPVPVLTGSDLKELCERFSGEIDQVPPAFSAVKVDGTRAYAAARRGQSLELRPRKVRIDLLELAVTGPDRLSVRVESGAGMYVRSLARDIGAALGCGGHLASLRRTRVGAFTVEEALPIASIQELADRGELATVVREMDEGVMEHDAIVLGSARAGLLAFGERIRVATAPWEPTTDARVYALDGTFHGIAGVDETGAIIPRKMLTPTAPVAVSGAPGPGAGRPSRWGEDVRS